MFFKRLVSVAASLVIVCGAVTDLGAYTAAPVYASGEKAQTSYSEVYKNGLLFAVYNDFAEVIDCDPELVHAVVPSTVNGVPVTAFADKSLSNGKIERLELPETIKTATGGLFWGAARLKEITVSPESTYFASLDGVLFSKDMKELICFPRSSQTTDYTIPDTVTRIGECAFNGSYLENLTIPDTVKYIEENAFWGCTVVNGFEFPGSVERIEYGNHVSDGVESVSFPEGLRFLGEYHFDPNTIKEIVFYSPYCFIQHLNLKKTGAVIKGYDGSTANEYANANGFTFESLGAIPPQLKNTLHKEGPVTYIIYTDHAELLRCEEDHKGDIVIPETIDEVPVTEINGAAFSGCTAVKSVSIPETVTEIGPYAFEACYSITEITIPSSVTEIKYDTFYKCNKLATVTIPDSIERIGVLAFNECFSLKTIDIPNSVRYIGDFAFSDCRELASVTIPDSVVSIGDGVFIKTPWLENEQGKDPLVTVNGILIDGKKASGAVEIPDSVTRICSGAFVGCESITSVVVPSSVWLIKDSAFANCKNLETITLLNPECRIGSGEQEKNIARTICNSSTNDSSEYTGVIKGYKDSTAEKYANKYRRTFAAIGEDIATTTSTSGTTTTTTTTTSTSSTTTTTTTTTAATTSTSSTTTTTTITTTAATTTTVTTAASSLFVHERDSWSFYNYGPNFRESGKLVLLENEKKRIDELKALYNKHTMNAVIDEFINNPGGACYGMTLLDMVYLSDRAHYLPLIQDGAQDLHSVELTDEVRSRINYYSLLQILPEIQYEIADTPKNGSSSDKAERLLKLLEDEPVLVCYQTHDKKGKAYSHAVLAYDAEPYQPEEGADEAFFETLDYKPGTDTLKMVKVYDPQYSSYSEKGNIFINETEISGRKTFLWNIMETYKFNDNDSRALLLVSNDMELLNKYGLFGDISGAEPDLSKSVPPKFTVSTRNTESGPLRYRINIGYDNFEWIGSSVNEEIPYFSAPDFYGDADEISTSKFFLKYPKEGYSFDYEDELSADTAIRTQYPDSLFDVEAEKLKSVTFDESTICFILDKNSSFKLRAISDKQSSSTDLHTVTIEGNATGKVECSYDGKGTWWVTSDSPLKNITVHASNDSDCFNQNVSNFNAASKVITIKYKKSSSLDKISIGNEEGGTSPAKSEPGDINSDSMIDAKDASAILVAYSKASTGAADGLTDEQRNCGDVNGDGMVDAKDASVILAYYSLVSTSTGAVPSLSEFASKNSA